VSQIFIIKKAGQLVSRRSIKWEGRGVGRVCLPTLLASRGRNTLKLTKRERDNYAESVTGI
jgi:hypothetical protein